MPAETITAVGAEDAKPAPGVIESIEAADVVLLPPSNPVVSVGTILAIPGIRAHFISSGWSLHLAMVTLPQVLRNIRIELIEASSSVGAPRSEGELP